MLAVPYLRGRTLAFPAEARAASNCHRAAFGLLHSSAVAAQTGPLDSHELGLALEAALHGAWQTGRL